MLTKRSKNYITLIEKNHVLSVLLRPRETSLSDRWSDTHVKKFIKSNLKEKRVLGKNICVCWKRKKKLYRSFFLSEQAHMAAPFSDTIYFLLKIQMSLGKEKLEY